MDVIIFGASSRRRSTLSDLPTYQSRQRNYSDTRYSGSSDLSRYRPGYNVTSPRYRSQYGYSDREPHSSYPGLTGGLYSDGGSMSKYTRSYDITNRNYDISGKQHEPSRLIDRGKFDNPDVAAPRFEFGINYNAPKTQDTSKSYDTTSKSYDTTTKSYDTSTRDYDTSATSYDVTRTDDVTTRRSPGRSISLSDRSHNQPTNVDAPAEYPTRHQGRQRLNSGDSSSSVSSEKSEDRSLLNVLKNRYKENAERKANDPATRAPFSTWRRSGHYDDVASSTTHDREKDKTTHQYEKSESLEKADRTESDLSKRDSHHEERSSTKDTESTTEPSPDDLLYNFRKALRRHQFSEHDKDEETKHVEDTSAIQQHAAQDMEGKLERLRAARARLQEQRSSDKPRPPSFATEFTAKPEKAKEEENKRLEETEASSAAETEVEQTKEKSTKLARQKLVSDDLKAKYIESKKDEEQEEALSKKRTSRKSRHKQHMEHWSKEKEKSPEVEISDKADSVPTVEEMLLGTTKHLDRSPSSAAKKFQNVDHSSPFGSVYTVKPATPSPSPSRASTISQDTEKAKVEIEQPAQQTPQQEQAEKKDTKPKSGGRKLKKYTKSKSLELGALGKPEPMEEPAKVEYQDDSNVGTSVSLDEASQASRLERINRYKEERKRQIAAISNKFDSREKELPSLFLSSKGVDSSVQRSKSLRVQSDDRHDTAPSSVVRSKSLKHERDISSDSSASEAPRMSGLKYAEIGDKMQPEPVKQQQEEKRDVNTEKIFQKLHALKKIREQHLRGETGMTLEELQSKRASKELRDWDDTSSVDTNVSYASKTLLADKVEDSSSLRVPNRDRYRSSSTEGNRSRESSRESTPKVRSLSEKGESSLKSKMRTFSDKSGDESTGRNLFEFGTVYTKKDKAKDSVKTSENIHGHSKISTIKERSRTPSEIDEESGRESVDSYSRIRRRLPSIEDVLGTSEDETFEKAKTITPPETVTPTNISTQQHQLTKENIAEMTGDEIKRKKVQDNIEKAKARFKDDGGYGVFGAKYEMGTKYSSKPAEKPKELEKHVKVSEPVERVQDQTDVSERSATTVDVEKARQEMLGVDVQTKVEQTKPSEIKVESSSETVHKEIDPYTGLVRIRQRSSKTKASRTPSRETSEEPVHERPEVSQTKITLSQVREKSEERIAEKYNAVQEETKHIESEEKDKSAAKPPSSPRSDRKSAIAAKFNKSSTESFQFGTVYTPKKEEPLVKPSYDAGLSPSVETQAKVSVASISLASEEDGKKTLEKQYSDKSKVSHQMKFDIKANSVSSASGKQMEVPTSPRRMSPVRALGEQSSVRSSFEEAKVAKPYEVTTESAQRAETVKEQLQFQPVSSLVYQPPEPAKATEPAVAKPAYSYEPKVPSKVAQSTAITKPVSFVYEPQAPAKVEIKKDPEVSKPISFAYEPPALVKAPTDIKREVVTPKPVSFAYEPQPSAKVSAVIKKEPQVQKSELSKPVSFAYEPKAPATVSEPQKAKPISFAVEPSAAAKVSAERKREPQMIKTEPSKPVAVAFEAPKVVAEVKKDIPIAVATVLPAAKREPTVIKPVQSKVVKPVEVKPPAETKKEQTTVMASKQQVVVKKSEPMTETIEPPSPSVQRSQPPTLEELFEKGKEADSRKSEDDLIKSETEVPVEAEHTILPSLTVEHKVRKRTNEEIEIAIEKEKREQKDKYDKTVAFMKVQDELVAKKKQMEKRRGRKVERSKSAKGKLEKSVLTKVRVESQLQDAATLDDILDRNVEYLSDLEPPDFSKGQKTEKKSSRQRVKRSLKKKSLPRSKSEDRSHFTVIDSDEDKAAVRSKLTQDLKSTSIKLPSQRSQTTAASQQSVSQQHGTTTAISRTVTKNADGLERDKTYSPVTQSTIQTGDGSRLGVDTSQVKQTKDGNQSEKISASISDMLYGKSEQSSEMTSDTSERSDRRRRHVMQHLDSRESETSKFTTDSDQSISSAMSDGSRKRRKDKSSLRKSKLNESGDDASTPIRRREHVDSRSSRSTVRRVASSRLAREPPPEKQGGKDEVFHSLKKHDLELSLLKRNPSEPEPSLHTSGSVDKPPSNLDLKHVNNSDTTRVAHKSVLDTHSVLPSRFALPSKVSTAITKLSEASEKSSRESSPLFKSTDQVNSPRGIRRENNFSKLLQKFSGSEASSSEKSDTDSPRTHKLHLKRQEAYSSSTGSSEESRRTPERTQSLRLRRTESPLSDRDSSGSSVQRSASFKSDFMKRRFSPDPENRRRLPETPQEQSDKPSPELANVLSRRNVIVAKQQEEGETIERQRIHDGRVERAEQYNAAKSDEVIADSEVLQMLRSRRKETDSSIEYSSVSESEKKSQIPATTSVPQKSTSVITLKQSDTPKHPVTQTTQHVQKPPETPESQKQQRLPSQSSFESKTTITLSPTPVKTATESAFTIPTPSLNVIKETPKPTTETTPTYVPKLDLSSVDTSVAVSKVASGLEQSADRNTRQEKSVSNFNVSSKSEVVQLTQNVQSEVKVKDVDKTEVVTSKTENVQLSYAPLQSKEVEEIRRPASPTATAPRTIDITSKSEIRKKISRDRTPERHSPLRSIPMKVTPPMKAQVLTRTESMGRSESERPKGILKRTPSLKQTGVIVDPELAEVLKSRRHRQDDVDEVDEQQKLTVEEEIQKERELQASKDGGEAREVSVAERVFQMHTKIEEVKSCPITPRRSGLTTPRSFLQLSGPGTPGNQFSFDEGNQKQEPLSVDQLSERLASLEGQQSLVSEKRKHFQLSRKRDDWRTRTQPVTLHEIQQADGLETVRKFRSEVVQKASVGLFDKLEEENTTTVQKKTEYPQHVKHERRHRGERHKTLPITAAELNAIPEGQISATTNTLKKKFETLGARDSKGDSGILSGSDGENLSRDSDSWRSLSMDENVEADDPVKLSVSAKASMFLQIQESIKEKSDKRSASGAKRYIDRKKRERSRTLPITEDEVKLAAEIADNEEAANKEEKPAEELTEAESDELSRQSLKDKVKLFTSIEEDKKVAAQKKGIVPPPPKRRNRKFASRFATQPVTIEEVEKAAKISPLACSLVKPPDPDILSGLSVKAQREIIAQHAEKALSQPSSRSGSRPTSRSTSVTDLSKVVLNEDVLTVTNTEVNENIGSWEPSDRVRPSDLKGKTFTAIKQEEHKVQTVEKISSDLDSKRKSILKSELEEKLSLSLHHDLAGKLKPHTDAVPTISDIKSVLKKDSSFERTKMEVKGILKKEGSFETRKPDSDSSAIIPCDITSDSSRDQDTSDAVDTDSKAGDGVESSGDNLDSDEGILDKVDTVKRSGQPRKSQDKRRFNRDRKLEAERYKTQPAETTASPETRPKKKYVGRHFTQPVTPDEKKEAEVVTAMPEVTKSSSINDRLNALKKNGEEGWKKRVPSGDLDNIERRSLSPPSTPPMVKMRDRKNLDTPRPSSIADRLSLLDSAQEGWRDRIGETDVKKFTIEHKISASGQAVGESPLVARLKGKGLKKELSRESDSSDYSELGSPSSPTKESSKIPMPSAVVCTDIPPELLKEESKSPLVTIKSEEEEKTPVKVEVPDMNAEMEHFFIKKDVLETTTSKEIDVSVDDFNELFMNANDILETTRKIKPKRRHNPSSRNPMKTMSACLEVKSEYTEVITGVAERELKRQKVAAISLNSGFAEEALAALATKENFSKVELRKTDSTGASRLDPYLPLMLIHIKGRRRVQCRLVEPSATALNSGDCFVMITADKNIMWCGDYCNVIEKAKAADFCDQVKQKRDLGCKGARDITILEEKKSRLGNGRQFWELLGGKKDVMACGPPEEDELYENHIIETNMIYQMEDNKLVPVQDCWGGQPKYEMLKSNQVYVFDFGSEVYLWQGKSVSPNQRKISIKLAEQVWNKGYNYSECAINPLSPLRTEEEGGLPSVGDTRPDWALFGKVNQNMETILFREKFADWPDTSRLIKVKSQEETNPTKIDLADLKAYDAKLMVPVNTSLVTLLLDGSNVGRGNKWEQDMDGFIQTQLVETLKVRIWHVLEYDHYEIEEHSFGQFHEGDTYVIRWQYMIVNAGMKNLKGQASRHSKMGRERCAYFFWQGKTSTINEKGASALMTVELDEERGPQVRLDEGKEPPCFLNLFKGRMIIHIGKREEEETNTVGPWRFYCLRNEFENEICLIEIPRDCSNLRSVSSFLFLNVKTGRLMVWHGCKSPDHTKKLAMAAADFLREKCPMEVGLHKGKDIIITEVNEGEEGLDFWRCVSVTRGDRSSYNSLLNNPESFNHTLRLFHMTSVSGVFAAQEIINPSRTPELPTKFPVLQTDLYKASQPALFLIDNGHEVYLWQGWLPEADENQENVLTGSAVTRLATERRCAMETTIQYCKEIRPDNPPKAYLVYAGLEPLSFTNLFPLWTVDESVKEINLRTILMSSHNIEFGGDIYMIIPNKTELQDGKTEGEKQLVEELYKKITKKRYTLAELLEIPPPEGVDPLKLESYLSDEEFEAVLDMTREEFYALPTWKQNKVKIQAALY